MNREQKRLMQRQGQMGTEGASSRRATSQDLARRRGQRTGLRQFFKEVREEMRQVAWPTRPEVINYTGIVTAVLIFMTALIFFLSLGFSDFVTYLFHK